MVKKIKKVKRRPRAQRSAGPDRAWHVPFTSEGQAGIFIHKHGDTDDHSNCGPVVMCCAKAQAPYQRIAPDLHQRVENYMNQAGSHLCTWVQGGVGAIYFVLCDPEDPDAIYQFGLDAERAIPFLRGQVPLSAYRLPECRHVAP